MSSVEPDEHADQHHARQKSLCELVVAGGDGTVFFDLLEEALDEIALAVEGEVGFALDFAIGFRRDHGRAAALLDRLEEGIRVVALVGDDRFGLDFGQQTLGLRDISDLAGRQRERYGIAERVDDGVDLGGQSTA